MPLVSKLTTNADWVLESFLRTQYANNDVLIFTLFDGQVRHDRNWGIPESSKSMRVDLTTRSHKIRK